MLGLLRGADIGMESGAEYQTSEELLVDEAQYWHYKEWRMAFLGHQESPPHLQSHWRLSDWGGYMLILNSFATISAVQRTCCYALIPHKHFTTQGVLLVDSPQCRTVNQNSLSDWPI